jgi:hypothetical protein
MSVGILEWQNETGLTAYPLQSSSSIDDFIVDASFVQFDNFIPTLVSVFPNSESIQITITFDTGNITVTYTLLDFEAGKNFVHIYQDGTKNRYLGSLVFGLGTANLFTNFVSVLMPLNIPFIPGTVTSVASNTGVFSFEGLIGDVVITRPATTLNDDNSIFFNVSGTNVVMNAVLYHAFLHNPPTQALTQVNRMGPQVQDGYSSNSIFISSNDVVKFNSTSVGTIDINLVGTTLAQTPIVVPSLAQ